MSFDISKHELKNNLKNAKEIPIRFCYEGNSWAKVVSDENYCLGNRELEILDEGLNKITENLDYPLNIIHLGIGTGREIPYVVKKIGLTNISCYAIVDINPAMLKKSKTLALKQFPNLKMKTFCQDIETNGIEHITRELKQKYAPRNLILLCGNSVLLSNDKIPQIIQKSMQPQDRFFLTLELFKKTKKKEIFQSYMTPSVLKLLSIGLRKANIKLNYDNFYGYYSPKKSRLKIFYSNNKHYFLVLSSYKPKNSKSLEKRMQKHGFKKCFLFENEKNNATAGLFKIE